MTAVHMVVVHEGPLGISGAWSSSGSSVDLSLEDEEFKMDRKAASGVKQKYVADVVPNYVEVCGPPELFRVGTSRKTTLCMPPPPYRMDYGQANVPATLPQSVGQLDEGQAREALLSFVAEHCCYGKGPAEEMALSDLRFTSGYHYQLETCAETRKVNWCSAPHQRREQVDHPSYGAAPMPWDVDAGPREMFCEEERKIEIPHTASVKKCWYCSGKGRVRCRDCRGSGAIGCRRCHTSGWVNEANSMERCSKCRGTGHLTCHRCRGEGRYPCRVCQGTKRLKWFISLTSRTETKTADHVEEHEGLPGDLIKDVAGLRVYEDTQRLVRPLCDFPVQGINQRSAEIVESEIRAYPESRCLMQRQSVNLVPITEATWEWKGKEGSFFVYGMDNKVYFPKYPRKCCCCCCTVL